MYDTLKGKNHISRHLKLFIYVRTLVVVVVLDLSSTEFFKGPGET